MEPNRPVTEMEKEIPTRKRTFLIWEWARYLVRIFFSSSIRYQIILPYLILTIIVAGLGILIVTHLVITGQEERLSNQLIKAARVVADGMIRKEREYLSTAWSIAFTEGIGEALEANDRERVAQLARAVAVSREANHVIVIDTTGQELLHIERQDDGTYRSPTQRFAVGELPIVQQLLTQNDPDAPYTHGLFLLSSESQSYYYMIAMPIGYEEKLVGVVLVGDSLNHLMEFFRTTSLADIVIYEIEDKESEEEEGINDEEINDEEIDDKVVIKAIASTLEAAVLPDQREALLEVLKPPSKRYGTILNGTKPTLSEGIELPSSETGFFENNAYRLAWGALRIGDDTIMLFAVALPMDFVVSESFKSRDTYVIIFTFGALAVIAIGYLISRRITKPLSRLVHTSRAVAEGDLEQRTGIVGEDEIGLLAETFDEMTMRLWERTQALEETVGRMQAILSSMSDGVMMEDTEGQLHILNDAAEQMLQNMSNNFLLRPVRDLSSIAKAARGANADIDADLKPWLLPQRKFEIGGQIINVYSSPIRTEDGDVLGTVIVMRDVTSEVAAERLKDQFITHVSHELRTPLTAIKGYSDLLLFASGDTLSAEQRDFVETINRNADDLIAMVNELLDFSEMEASGRLGAIPKPTPLLDLVMDVVEMWEPRMQHKGLTFQLKMPDDLPMINADSRRLRWAFIHVLRNALQYTPEGGKVTMELVPQGDSIAIHVTDTGIGISPEQQARLFTRFYRVTNMPEGEVRGLGVGLYLTRAIIEAHNGEIHVVSEEGKGSTFTITLPVLKPKEPTSE